MLRDFPVPVRSAERAAAWLANRPGGGPVEARASATVLLLRDGARGVEVFLLRRAASMAFAAGMQAFPGGGVDPRDADAGLPWAGPAPAWWATALGVDVPAARSLVCAAVRETFEESGVLLAGRDAGHAVPDVTGKEWEAARRALLAREVSLSDLLRERGLVLRSDLLRPWAHWITPEFEQRRYDTRFFAACLPTGQCAREVFGESDAAAWWPAGDAVAAHQGGELEMLSPTLVALQEVACAPDCATALRQARRLRPVMPELHRLPDGRLVLRADLDGRGGGRPGSPAPPPLETRA